MSFELVPCAVFITILTINNISAGGIKLLTQGLIAMLVAGLISSLITSPTVNLESDFIIVLFCIPMIIIYPMVLSLVNYKLTRLMIRQRKKLLHISRNDGLTGVFSRRYWEQRLLEEFNRCRRSGESACVMMIDIDHFKNINDNYGHLVGDNVLKQFGQLLKELRNSDIVGRYGGEEFAVLLPNSSFKESLFVAERLRQTIENMRFEQVGSCTVSIGIAPLDNDFVDAYKWLDSADKALYQAKSSGRNRVKCYQQGRIKSALSMTVCHDYI
jgi:diguanylate cyclase